MKVCFLGLCLRQGLDNQDAFVDRRSPCEGGTGFRLLHHSLLGGVAAVTSLTRFTHAYLVVTFLRRSDLIYLVQSSLSEGVLSIDTLCTQTPEVFLSTTCVPGLVLGTGTKTEKSLPSGSSDSCGGGNDKDKCLNTIGYSK